jgi:hypothetical protein
VTVDELLVDSTLGDDLAGDVVEDGKIGLGLEDDFLVRQIGGAIAEGGEVDHPIIGVGQTFVGDPRPQHRVHLRHVGAPQHHRVGELDIVVAARRLIDAKGLDKAGDCRGHAVTGVGVDVVGAPTGFEQLDGGVTLLDGVLSRPHDPHSGGPQLTVDPLELSLHLVEGPLPADGDEVAVLGELAVLHPHQWLREAILAVEDLGIGIALDTEQPPVDRVFAVALDGHHPALVGGDANTTADAAKATDSLVPTPAVLLAIGGYR